MTANERGDTLYVWGGPVGEGPSLAMVSVADSSVVVVDSSWVRIQFSNGLVLLPPIVDQTAGDLAVIGVRNGDVGGLETAPLRLLNRHTLALVDSVPHSTMPFGQRMFAVLPCPQSSRLLLVGAASLVIYDREQRLAVGNAPIRGFGSLDASPGCETVVLGDAGRDAFRDDDGSGLLWVYRNALQSIDSIDISTPLGGVPFTSSATRSNGVVLMDGAQDAWVRIGHNTGRANALRQRARLLRVDLQSGAIRRVIDLGGESSGGLWRVPR